MIQLRTMQLDDVSHGYRLSQQVKWPHRQEDWAQALSLGEGLVAETEKGIVGCAVIWPWEGQHSTLGLVIVDPSCQGQGIGKKLMEGLLEKVPNSNVRLHATEMGKGLYEKYGFRVQRPIFQHQTTQLPVIAARQLSVDEKIRPLCEHELSSLIDNDYQSHGMLRPALWQNLFNSADALLVLEKSGSITGYMVIRKFGRGTVIGPMLAQDEDSAQALFCHGASQLVGQFLRLDTYGNTPFSNWLVEQGLPCIDAPLIMVKGIPWQRAEQAMQDFSLMSQAMG